MISAGRDVRPVGRRMIFVGRPNFLPDLGLGFGARRCRFADGLVSVELGGVAGRDRSRGFGRGLATVPVPMMMMGVFDDGSREVRV
jgi:hypothetical protein